MTSSFKYQIASPNEESQASLREIIQATGKGAWSFYAHPAHRHSEIHTLNWFSNFPAPDRLQALSKEKGHLESYQQE